MLENLPFKITPEDMYDIFGKFGAIRQIRVGNQPDTRGTAFVVYEDIFDAKNALEHLSGFNVLGRYVSALFSFQFVANRSYLIVLYYQQSRMEQRLDAVKKKAEIERLKAKFGVPGADANRSDRAGQ
jgi:pre-mRNA branch site protein p14